MVEQSQLDQACAVGACLDPQAVSTSKVSAGAKGLPPAVRITILPACSSSPKQRPQRSAPHSSRKASYRPPSSYAVCSPPLPTTCRRGSAHASLPDGCRCRLDRPGCLGAGARSPEAERSPAALGDAAGDLTATVVDPVTASAGMEHITRRARSARSGAPAGWRRGYRWSRGAPDPARPKK